MLPKPLLRQAVQPKNLQEALDKLRKNSRNTVTLRMEGIVGTEVYELAG
jgi:hypothetical protein